MQQQKTDYKGIDKNISLFAGNCSNRNNRIYQSNQHTKVNHISTH